MLRTRVEFILSQLGCQIVPPLTPQQKRAMQIKTFENTYNNVFKAVKSVLLDEGYIIKNQDFEGGLILGSKDTNENGGFPLSVFLGSSDDDDDYDPVVSKKHEVSVNLEKINSNLTETRVVFQTTTQTQKGQKSSRQILDMETYNSLYQKLSVETARRRARGMR